MRLIAKLTSGAAATGLFLAFAATLPAGASAPGVAYISSMNGDVSVQRGDSNDVEAAAVNAPLMVGDGVATDASGRSEIQFDYGHVLREGPNSQIRFAQLDNSDDTIQLAAGTVGVGVLHPTSAYTEVETPSITVEPRDPGFYRVVVRPDGTTAISVRSGDAAILFPQGTQYLAPGSTMLVWGPASNPSYRFAGEPGDDNFDRWNLSRDQAFLQANNYNYGPAWMPGLYDLSGDGDWQNDPSYGNVWEPTDVPADWTPYSTGRWVYEPYYGWTWVDNDAWGYAPFHYGRWFHDRHHRWAWDPDGGVLAAAQPWSPALVAFVGFGGNGFSVGLSLVNNIGWVPLAPNEPLQPWWGNGYGPSASISYVNYNVTNVTSVYRNARWPRAVRGMSRADFAGGRYQRSDPVPARYLGHAAIVRNALPIIPSAQALRFSNRSVASGRAPSAQAFHRFSTTPRSPATFSQQRRETVAFTQHTHIGAVNAARPRPQFAPRAQQQRSAIGGRSAPQFARPQQQRSAIQAHSAPQFARPQQQRSAIQARPAPQFARPQQQRSAIQAHPAPQFARPQQQRSAIQAHPAPQFARPQQQRSAIQARPAAQFARPQQQRPAVQARPAPQIARPQFVPRAQPAQPAAQPRPQFVPRAQPAAQPRTQFVPRAQPAQPAAQPRPQFVPRAQPAQPAAQPRPQFVPRAQPAQPAAQPRPQFVPRAQPAQPAAQPRPQFVPRAQPAQPAAPAAARPAPQAAPQRGRERQPNG